MTSKFFEQTLLSNIFCRDASLAKIQLFLDSNSLKPLHVGPNYYSLGKYGIAVDTRDSKCYLVIHENGTFSQEKLKTFQEILFTINMIFACKINENFQEDQVDNLIFVYLGDKKSETLRQFNSSKNEKSDPLQALMAFRAKNNNSSSPPPVTITTTSDGWTTKIRAQEPQVQVYEELSSDEEEEHVPHKVLPRCNDPKCWDCEFAHDDNETQVVVSTTTTTKSKPGPKKSIQKKKAPKKSCWYSGCDKGARGIIMVGDETFGLCPVHRTEFIETYGSEPLLGGDFKCNTCKKTFVKSEFKVVKSGQESHRIHKICPKFNLKGNQ